LQQCTGKSHCCTSNFGSLLPEPRLVHSKAVRVGQDDCPLNYVLKLTNIARPLIRLEEFQGSLIDCSELLSSLASKSGDEVFDEQGNVSRALPQRGHLNRHNIQSIQEILAKLSFRYQRVQISMRGGHHSYVNRDWFVAADALDFTLLQHAQKRNLYFGRQVADFVQEDCPVARRLKTPKAPLRRTSEGTFLVPEELRSNQRWRDRGAIHTDKCS